MKTGKFTVSPRCTIPIEKPLSASQKIIRAKETSGYLSDFGVAPTLKARLAIEDLLGIVEVMQRHNDILVKALRQTQSIANEAFKESEAFVEINDYEEAILEMVTGGIE